MGTMDADEILYDQCAARYWQELIELFVHAEYVSLYTRQTEFICRSISIFVAIMSSSSIGGWMIWNHIPQVWATLIAISHLVQVLKDFLPYEKRLKSLVALNAELRSLVIEAEDQWHQIAAGSIGSDEVNKLYTELKKRILSSTNKSFPSDTLPNNKNFLELAEEASKRYFTSRYGA